MSTANASSGADSKGAQKRITSRANRVRFVKAAVMANTSELPENQWENFTKYPEDADTSMFPFPGEMWIIRPSLEVGLKVASLLPIMLVGVLGNASLVHAIASNPRLRSSTTNLLILNMAVADFCTSLVCPGVFLGVDLFQNYIFGEVGCRLDGFLLQALTLVAVFSLSAVSYDRVSAIVLDCSGRLTLGSTRGLIAMTWILALVVAGPLAFLRSFYIREWNNWTEKFCAETKTNWPYWHLVVGVSVWMPLAVMAVCYSTILIKLGRYERQALKSKHPIVVRYKARVAKILSLVVLAFIVSRVPFTGLVMRRAHQRLNDDYKIGQANSMYILWYLSRYLVFVSAALNPLLYGCTSGPLRQQLASYPPLFWIILKHHHEKEKLSKSARRQNTLKPRSPCGVRFTDKDGAVEKGIHLELPNISSTVQSRSSESKFLRKLRIGSIMSNFSGSFVDRERSTK